MSKRVPKEKYKSRNQVLSQSQPSLTQMNYVTYRPNRKDEQKRRKTSTTQTNKAKVVSPYKGSPSVPRNVQERPKAADQIEPPNSPPTPHEGEDLGLDVEEHIPQDVQDEDERMKADIDLYEQDQRLLTSPEEEDDDKEDTNDEEGDYIKSVTEPPATIGKYKSPIGELEYAMPHLEHRYKGTSHSLLKVRKPKLDRVFNTFFHFKDRKYNSSLHKIVNGLIREWRRGVHDMCDDLEKTEDLSNRQGYRNQRNYADTTALLIQHCIANYDEFPVKILNMHWMTTMLPAVKTLQDARLVYHMSNCTYFELSINKVGNTNEASIMTRFDGKVDVLIGYKL